MPEEIPEEAFTEEAEEEPPETEGEILPEENTEE